MRYVMIAMMLVVFLSLKSVAEAVMFHHETTSAGLLPCQEAEYERFALNLGPVGDSGCVYSEYTKLLATEHLDCRSRHEQFVENCLKERVTTRPR